MSVSIQDILPLTPQQEALLWHALRAGTADRGSLTYGFRIEGELEPTALRRAWATVLRRHPMLRTSFHWEGLPAPRQVVHREVELPWREEDLRGAEPARRVRRREALAGERLELTTAPLLRLHLLRTGERTWEFLWRVHHLVLDGWSVFVVLGDVFRCYGAFRQGVEPDLPPARPFKDFLLWLRGRERTTSAAFWREHLAGLTAPTPAPAGTPSGRGGGTVAAALPARTSAALTAWARRERLTLSTVVLGAFGLVLAGLTGRRDLVLGVTVSGRPAELPDVEGIVGPFTNVLPVRLRLPRGETAAAWLRDLHRLQLRLREEETTALADIQEWSGLPAAALFESLLLFQNYPHEAAPAAPGLRLGEFRWQTTTVYPLTVAALPGERLELYVHYDRARFGPADARRILAAWVGLLRGLARRPHAPLADLPLPAAVSPPPPPPAPAPPARTARRPPATPIQERVAALWGEVLGVREVCREDNFFDLGGSSLLLMQVVRRLEKEFGVRLNPWELIFQTLEQVAALVEEKVRTAPSPPPGLGARLWRRLKGTAGRRKS